MVKTFSAVLVLGVLFGISACTNNQTWGDCPKEDRATVFKLSAGSQPNKEVLTIKLLSTGEEFTYPEHTKQKGEPGLNLGDHFCTAEDYD